MHTVDTICAVATAVGEGGIGIIRMSGPDVYRVADLLFCSAGGRRVEQVGSFQAVYGHIVHPVSKKIIDEVILLVMRAPRSYTREDVVEIHCHGGPVPLRQILGLLLDQGIRLAEPGEFTKRAFLNGRLDLTQAEAVIDVIRAKTDASLAVAVGQLNGTLSEKIRSFRQEILRLIAHLEAAVDFPEEDIEEIASQDVAATVTALLPELDRLLDCAQTGRILREGLQTVIIGRPNVGKSSLLNALVREQRAIVTDIPGTTRDAIEEYVNIRGVPLKIVDTAGIRETSDQIEKIGVERAREFVGKADLILLVLDSSALLTEEDKQIMQFLQGKKSLVLVNKSDLPPAFSIAELGSWGKEQRVIPISVRTGEGIDKVEQAIVDMVYGGEVSRPEAALVSNARQVHLLGTARARLVDVLQAADRGLPVDCLVIDLRSAWQSLGEITGDTVGEDILDQIFSQFCIGK